MIKAEVVDKTTVIKVLISSFEDNQSVNFIIRKDEKRARRIQALMDYSYEICSLFGEVWLSDDKNACALILYPQQKRTTLKSIWLDIRLIVQAVGLSGISKALKREEKIKKLQPRENIAYLWFIGVDPEFQHKGIGSKLMKEIIAESNRKHLPVYLETSTLRNIPWYEVLGFHTYNQLELGYTLFFLKREPDK
ncbi:GNAT family N-acetyltransferase [Mucilaginibacter rubeus]|uniref:GNAT family N-acetyltransferase n=2 Tax=Mucilaginibacter rubeus TaxID=2027860 RepID=A0A364WQT8_9SPHI|nr:MULTISPECIES: GNAT family N-acetyltransferase [Mucilaginibacter]QEM06202.1 GNAT family N-acetyltransferase [Mucilaginibacter rubeus]QEM13719.1 GNAT family N-acetyltransferase [Mucilaginibacter rubeus]QEM18785.1 GNAT family N-acetyltransferase [Mucilaginibacter gossypii]QTE36220.1 GNAT family N-acetyltransferase [Mucilaginibacter gossypii]QTE44673.1 GNAT family N-acetyltransferase [Mucilaginibacter rubeus]